jgi:TolB-like protein
MILTLPVFLCLDLTEGCTAGGSQDGHAALAADSTLLVVPFETLGDSGGGWFGVGLAADVERLLSTGAAVTIYPWKADLYANASRGTSLSNDTTLLYLGRTARVSLVLGGSLKREGVRSELSLRLLRVSDGTNLWSGTYWREAASLPSFPGEIALEVANALRHAPPQRP